ncbi:MAG: hypothetical protein ACFFD7_12230, partial [Candidatus Thorarchaeota archaeon]
RMGPGIILNHHDRERTHSLQFPINIIRKKARYDPSYHSTICNAKKFNFRRFSKCFRLCS